MLGHALKYICPTCSTNCLTDVHLYRKNVLFEGSLVVAFGSDKGADGKSWQEIQCDNCELYRNGLIQCAFKGADLKGTANVFVFAVQCTNAKQIVLM